MYRHSMRIRPASSRNGDLRNQEGKAISAGPIVISLDGSYPVIAKRAAVRVAEPPLSHSGAPAQWPAFRSALTPTARTIGRTARSIVLTGLHGAQYFDRLHCAQLLETCSPRARIRHLCG